MRVTAGRIGGRTIRVPKAPPIRPTQDRVRQAVFSALGEAAAGVRALDLYAGTGAMGLEAWSRGAASVVWVEADRRVAATLEENVRALCAGAGPGAARVVRMDALAFLARPPPGLEPFGLILADPPYDRGADRGTWEQVLSAIESGGILSADGLLVYEMGADEAVAPRPGWTWLRDRNYGGTRVVIGRWAGPGRAPGKPAEETR